MVQLIFHEALKIKNMYTHKKTTTILHKLSNLNCLTLYCWANIAKFWQDRKLNAKLWILISWSVVSKNRIYLGSAGQRLIWYLCKCIYYNIVTLFISTSIHFYFTLLVGNYLGILSSAVFSKLIYYIVPSLSLSESQTVWIQIRSGILSVLIWF